MSSVPLNDPSDMFELVVMLAMSPFFNSNEPTLRSMVIGTWVPSSARATLILMTPELVEMRVENMPLEEDVSCATGVQIPVRLVLR